MIFFFKEMDANEFRKFSMTFHFKSSEGETFTLPFLPFRESKEHLNFTTDVLASSYQRSKPLFLLFLFFRCCSCCFSVLFCFFNNHEESFDKATFLFFFFKSNNKYRCDPRIDEMNCNENNNQQMLITFLTRYR